MEGRSCATAKTVPTLESRKERMRENKLNSMKTAPPTQDGKRATVSPKQCSRNGKDTSEIRSVLCLKKPFLCSAATVVAWHLLYLERFNWWAEVTALSAAYAQLIERHSGVLASSASWALCFLAALASLAAESQSPMETVASIPQKPRYWLDKAPGSTQILIVMREICNRATWLWKLFAEWQTCLCGALPAPFISPDPWSPAHCFLESPNAQSAARIQSACGRILYANALLWSQILHHNMSAPCCIPNLWNEFICRGF